MSKLGKNVLLTVGLGAWIFAFLCHVQGVQGDEDNGLKNNAEKRLFDHLFRDYDRRVRPVRNPSDTVIVWVALLLGFISDLDERQQILRCNFWMLTSWSDIHLSWNPDHFDGLTKIIVPGNTLWYPDFVVANENGRMYHDAFYDRFQVAVFNDSTVRWSPGGEVSFNCPMNVRSFPFDTQVCSILFEMWMPTAEEVRFELINPNATFMRQQYHGMWEVLATETETKLLPYTTGMFSQLNFHITLKRSSLYFILYTIIPCFMLGILNLFLFVLPPGSGEKTSLGMTIILSYFVFLLLVAERLPATSSDHIPLFAIYLVVVIVLSTFSLMCASLVVYLHNHGQDYKVPRFFKKLFSHTFRRRTTPQPTSTQIFSTGFDGTSNKLVSEVNNLVLSAQMETDTRMQGKSGRVEGEGFVMARILDKVFLVIFTSLFCIFTLVFFVQILAAS